MSIQKSKTRASLIFSIVLVVAGCATQGGDYNNTFGGMNTAEIAGGLLGAAAGAYGGSRIGHGATPYITGALGAAAGAWIGKSIASYLTQSAHQQMAGATQSRPCRTVEQTITLSNGTKRKEQVTACQGANGWEAI